MLCPNCTKEMLVLEFELVEIDHCPECGGVWLDSGELALIGKRAGALHDDLLAAMESSQGEPQKARPKRRCPLCRKPFLDVRTPGGRDIHGSAAAPLLFEKCPRNDGLWFEAGALQAVIHGAGVNTGNVFARFLADLDARRNTREPPRHKATLREGGA